MRWEERDAMCRFPLAVADNTEVAAGCQRIAVTGAAQTFALPKGWLGRYINFAFRANGSTLTYGQVAVATSAQSLVLNQASNAAAGSSSAAAGRTLAVEEAMDRVTLDTGVTHLCWIGASAAGYAEFFLSEKTAKID